MNRAVQPPDEVGFQPRLEVAVAKDHREGRVPEPGLNLTSGDRSARCWLALGRPGLEWRPFVAAKLILLRDDRDRSAKEERLLFHSCEESEELD